MTWLNLAWLLPTSLVLGFGVVRWFRFPDDRKTTVRFVVLLVSFLGLTRFLALAAIGLRRP
jgi:hypothetical protein